MKGGITSGVVYPKAVVDLARKFRFKNIGGTSAGAIAAAAAAAELGRERGGFEQLANLPDFLARSAPGTHHSNLFQLFQPQHSTRKLFHIATAALGGGGTAALRVLGAALRSYPTESFLGALLGLSLIVAALSYAQGVLLALCLVAGVILLVLGTLIALVLALLDQVRDCLPRNFFGLCSGMPEPATPTANPPSGTAAPPPLTPWLTEYLDQLAGLHRCEQPLTFGDLWGAGPTSDQREINLEMMTTCLTHGRPYRLPFRDDDDIHENIFYFDPTEFRRLFPEKVVRWMEEHPRPAKDLERRDRLQKQGLRPLPAPRDLPVIVAVRMSLSFPILLGAVPLYALAWTRRNGDPTPPATPEKAERCWFSDGGICSNFPLHFFDSPLPRWPTLSINLVAKPRETPDDILREPEMVQRNSDGIQERWNHFEHVEWARPAGWVHREEKSGLGKVLGFLGAIVGTMQNWTDSVQSRLPGYRDRIAHVGLTPQEGGLNLDMPEPLIAKLCARGSSVAEKFVERFGASHAPDPCVTMDWENHRWLRLRSFLASFESLVGKMDKACANPQPGDPSYADWLAENPARRGTSYDWKSDDQRALAQETVETLRTLTRKWNRLGVSVAPGAPRPRPELRTRPQV